MKSARETTPPRRALAEAQLGHRRSIVRRGDPLQFQLLGEHSSAAIATDAPAIAGDGRVQDFGFIEICPRFARRVKWLRRMPAAACYFAWGCFRYFGSARRRRGVLQRHPGVFGTQPNNPGSERSRLHALMIALATLDTAGAPAQNRKKP